MMKINKALGLAAFLMLTVLAAALCACSSERTGAGQSAGTGVEGTVNSNDGYTDGGIGRADDERADGGAVGEMIDNAGNAANDVKNSIENGMNDMKNAVEENFGVDSQTAGGNATANY